VLFHRGEGARAPPARFKAAAGPSEKAFCTEPSTSGANASNGTPTGRQPLDLTEQRDQMVRGHDPDGVVSPAIVLGQARTAADRATSRCPDAGSPATAAHARQPLETDRRGRERL